MSCDSMLRKTFMVWGSCWLGQDRALSRTGSQPVLSVAVAGADKFYRALSDSPNLISQSL